MYPKIFDSFAAPHMPKLNTTRRGFLLGALVTAGALSVGFRWNSPAAAQDQPKVHPFQPYVAIKRIGATQHFV